MRDIAQLDRTLRTVSALSSSMAHDLREGLAHGPEEYRLRLRRAAQAADLPKDVTADDIRNLRPAPASEDDGPPAGTVVRLLDALLLDALLLDAIARPKGTAAVDEGPAMPVASGAVT